MRIANLMTTAFAAAVIAASVAPTFAAEKSGQPSTGMPSDVGRTGSAPHTDTGAGTGQSGGAATSTTNPASGMPSDVGRTGSAPHTDTGAGTGQSGGATSKPTAPPESAGGKGTGATDPSGKRTDDVGKTDEGNVGAREQKMGEKPAP
jgi:hypothetical protein